jgi:hypothetical protein
MLQATKTNSSFCPQRKIVKREREREREMAGDRNRPLGLLLERKMMMLI